MNFLESMVIIEEAIEEFDAKWGDEDLDSWGMGVRTRFRIMGQLCMELKKAIVLEQNMVEALANIAALCVYWIMADYNYHPRAAQGAQEAPLPTGAYL